MVFPPAGTGTIGGVGKDRFVEHGKDRDLQRTYRGRAQRDEHDDPPLRQGPERAVLIQSVPRADEDSADSLSKLSQRVGITVESLSTLIPVADLAGDGHQADRGVQGVGAPLAR